ncbi:MAG: hypothetical protein GF329_00860 [Candidatus Lokiarchaeota archaeon]|nr:hypothetical protein [Candidatus Lokiarchaeota archaeon]
MKGVLLCKFDENKGYIPVRVFPQYIYSDETKQFFRDIAKNAIGFGSSIEYNQFDINDTHAISRRFTRKVANARGGVEIFSLVLLVEENTFEKEVMEELTNKLIENWEDRQIILEEIYNVLIEKTTFNEHKQEEFDEFDENLAPINNSHITVNSTLGKNEQRRRKKSILFKDELIKPEYESFFASTVNPPRNIIMVISMLLIMLMFGFNYDFISFIILFDFGVLFFSFINDRKKLMRISVGVLSIFILYVVIGIILLMLYDLSLLIRPDFPDVLTQPHWALLSFLCGFLVCIGLDRGKKIDKISTIIGSIFLVLDVIIFLIIPVLLSL